MQMAIVYSLMNYDGIFSLIGFLTAVHEKLFDIAFKEPIAKNAVELNFFLCMKVGYKML